MNRTIKLIRQLIADHIPLNIVTIEDEQCIRDLLGITPEQASFTTPYDRNCVNISLGFSAEEVRELLKDRPNIDEVMRKNEHYTFSELNVLSQGRDLLGAYDDLSNATPAEARALNSDLNYPGELLRENLKAQCKIPTSRAVRITGKYTDQAEGLM